MTITRSKLKFRDRIKIKHPEVIRRGTDYNGNATFETGQALGDFYRVFPQNEDEVNYLESLAHQADKYAPAEGNGILVRKVMIDSVLK